jgi:hypothetical protein
MIAAGCKSSDSRGPAASNTTPASTPASTPAANSVKSRIDSCGLLASDELKQVAGESLKQALKADRESDGLIVSECYYSFPTPGNSVMVNVTTSAEGKGARDPREFWKQTIGVAEKDGGDKDQDRDRNRNLKKEAEKEKSGPPPQEGERDEESVPPPQKISGLGDDAYWLANKNGGVLCVLKNDAFFRVSVGGPGSADSKLSKSKTLARMVLGRM